MDRDSPQLHSRTCGLRRPMLVLIALMLLPVGSLLAGTYQLFPFSCLPLLILATGLLARDRPDPAGPGDDAEGPGDDGGSPTPDISPNLPSGGLLLPDAQPAPRRHRGQPASPLIPSPTRRPSHPPDRRPAPRRH